MIIGKRYNNTRRVRKMTQENSFPCRKCGEMFTEESGASENFICENCYTEDYRTPEFKYMIMTYSDKTLGEYK